MRRAPQAFTFELEGQPIPAAPGDSVAVSLWAHGLRVFARSPKYHRPRGPFCFSGTCGQCLMRVDGVPNLETCQTPARAGLRVERQNAFPVPDLDVLAAADRLFPRGLDHHRLLTWLPFGQALLVPAVRRLSGLGHLPDAPGPAAPKLLVERHAVVIVGVGHAGRRASEVLTRAGVAHATIDPGDPSRLDAAWSPTHPNTVALAFYEDAGGRFLLCRRVDAPGRALLKLYATRVILATGGYDGLTPFENNDLPGVISARAVIQLWEVHGVRAGRRVAVVGDSPVRRRALSALEAAGAQLVLHARASWEALRARGRGRVRGVTARSAGGQVVEVACDAIAVCAPAAPAFELARQAEAEVRLGSSGFQVVVDPRGRTSLDWLFAAGEITGACTPDEACHQGERAARAVATTASDPVA